MIKNKDNTDPVIMITRVVLESPPPRVGPIPVVEGIFTLGVDLVLHFVIFSILAGADLRKEGSSVMDNEVFSLSR